METRTFRFRGVVYGRGRDGRDARPRKTLGSAASRKSPRKMTPPLTANQAGLKSPGSNRLVITRITRYKHSARRKNRARSTCIIASPGAFNLPNRFLGVPPISCVYLIAFPSAGPIPNIRIGVNRLSLGKHARGTCIAKTASKQISLNPGEPADKQKSRRSPITSR